MLPPKYQVFIISLVYLEGSISIYGATAPLLSKNRKAGSKEPAFHDIINYANK